MKKIYSLSMVLLLLCATQGSNAQSQNSLDFDGIDDYVTVTNASSLITFSNQISLSLWVYPRNPSPAFPDFDGLAGFRNNTSADFYLLHYSATSVEARFRNSNGVNFDIISQGLQLNTWQHYVLTYDGAYLRVYRNGVAADSVLASGSIASSSETFYIGNQIYQGTNYYLDGKLDDVALWNRTLSPAEINCIYRSKVSTTSANLQLYYDMNIGVANGNNAGLNQIPDRALNINGILQNFALTGTGSNFVDGVNNATVVSATLCAGQSYSFNGQNLTAAGVYSATLTSSQGCDSIVQLTLQVADTAVTQLQATLTAAQTGATYQWVDCGNNYAAITNATAQSYTATTNGSYAVIISWNGCVDTSACKSVTVSGLNSASETGLMVYPNPAVNQLTVKTDVPAITEFGLYDMAGKKIFESRRLLSNAFDFDISFLPKGTYIFQITSAQKNMHVKVVKD
jgi:hypothetical protein